MRYLILTALILGGCLKKNPYKDIYKTGEEDKKSINKISADELDKSFRLALKDFHLETAQILKEKINSFKEDVELLKSIHNISKEEKVCYGIAGALRGSCDYLSNQEPNLIQKLAENLIDAITVDSSYVDFKRALMRSMKEYGGGNVIHMWQEICQDNQALVGTIGAILKGIGSEYEMHKVINFRDSRGMTPLHRGVALLQEEVVEELLKRGASKDVKDFDERKVVDYLGVWKHCNKEGDEEKKIEKIRELLQDEEAKEVCSLQSLHICRVLGNKELFRRIYRNNIKQYGYDDRRTVAIECALAGWIEIFEDLIKSKLSYESQDFYAKVAAYMGGYSLFYNLKEKHSSEYTNNIMSGGNIALAGKVLRAAVEEPQYLFEAKKDLDEDLLIAIKKGHTLIVEALLEREEYSSERIKASYVQQMTFAAVRGGHNLILELFIEKVNDVNFRSGKYKSTALMVAANKGHMQVVKTLLKNKADVNLKDNEGETALVYAVRRCRKEVTELLILKDAYVNLENHNGKTALTLASNFGDSDIVNMLLTNGANIDGQDKEKKTSLIYATISGHKGVVKTLLSRKADLTLRDKEGRTALMHAAIKGYKGIANLLLENGARVDEQDKEKKTLLIHAAIKGHEGVVKVLLENGADINAVSSKGMTASMYAADRGHEEVMQILIENGANINAESNEGMTTLMYAARSGRKKVVQLLLNN